MSQIVVVSRWHYRYWFGIAVILVWGVGCSTVAPGRAVSSHFDMLQPDLLMGTPPGQGPFPVVILLHGCGGRSQEGATNRENVYREALLAQGLAWLSVRSFPLSGRPFTSVCGRSAETLDVEARVADLAVVMQHLGQYPQLDARRVGVLGFSMGAQTALRAAMRLDPASAPGFRSAVALYGGCRDLPASDGILGQRRVLMLLGGKDTWTSAKRCVALGEALRAGGHAAEAVVYPEATHQWDNPGSAGGRDISMGPGKGTTFVRYDPETTQDSVQRAVAYFRATLLEP